MQEADARQLDEVPEGETAVYIVDGRKVGPNGREIKNGKELPPEAPVF